MSPTRVLRLACGLLVASSVSLASIQPVVADGTDVTTGYPTDGVADVVWAAEHLGYGGPGELQKAGVQVLRFLLVAIAGVTDDECDTDLGADLNPSGPYLYTSTWDDEEVDALDWVADHYCLTPEQTQLLGGSVLAFLAGLDAADNGTTAVRGDPPLISDATGATSTTAPPAITVPPNKIGEPEAEADTTDLTSVDSGQPSIPGLPADLGVVPGIGSALLSWTPPDVLGGNDTTYTVRYRPAFPAPYALVAEPAIAGRILFMSDRDGDWELFVMNADGTGVYPLTDNTVDDWSGRFSPDGAQVIFDGDHDGDVDVFSVDADGANLRTLTDNTHEDAFPAWSPDGTRIVFQSNRTGTHEIFTMDTDGSRVQQVTNLAVGNFAVPDWSPDGTRLAFSGAMDGDPEIYVVDLDGGGLQQLTVNDGIADRWPKWSPDGAQIVFESDRDGDRELFTMGVDGGDVRQLTTNSGMADMEPSWSPDGSRIAFTRGEAGSPELFVMDADGSDILGPLTIGEQAHWQPDAPVVANASSTGRKTQIASGGPPWRTPLIVTGEAADIDDYPFMVALLYADRGSAYNSQYCAGTLLAPRWVLTAAHCLEAADGGRLGVSDLEVAAGRTNLSDVGVNDRYAAEAIYRHPSYEKELTVNDLALIRLRRAIPGSVVAPLPWLEDSTVPRDGTPILKIGWGSTEHVENGPFPDGLRTVTVNVLGDPGYDFCSTDTLFDSSNRICTGSPAQKGACAGDSGGPNVIDIDGFWYLAGITSYGMTEDDDLCGYDVDVATRVSSYADWITSYLGFQWTWETEITGPSHVLDGLQNGWTYTFQVKAENTLGVSPYTEPKTVVIHTPETALFDVPGEPTEVMAQAGTGLVTLTWGPPLESSASPLTYSVVHYEPAGELPVTTSMGRPDPAQSLLESAGSRVVPAIVGGTQASISEHPYIVPLLDAAVSDAVDAHFCAGTLVSPRWVVTAAHCVDDRTAGRMQIVAGMADLKAVTAHDRIGVLAIHMHPDYRPDNLNHDIALLQLSSEVTSTDARWIPWQTDGNLPLAGTDLTSAGWGASVVDGSNRESELHSAPGVTIGAPDEDRCGYWSTFESTQWLCVGGREEVGSCTGDGGGPVLANLGMTRLVGVIAYGRGGLCADSLLPNVATRISRYAYWIAERVGDPWKEASSLTGTAHTVAGLVNGLDYRFYVSAVDALGRSSVPVVVMARPRA